ncbi:MAG TPA: lytic murein transglycosylase [Devosiaceae bacterium]|jgi:membrane-bound lytic murein transglycosylase B
MLLGASAWLASAAAMPALAANVGSFVDGVWKQASARGVSRAVFNAAMADFQPLDSVMKLTQSQAEFATTAGTYVDKRVNPSRIGEGKAMRGEWAQTLSAVSNAYGVQPEAMLAIWGIETNYGGYVGTTNTVHALATLTYGGYRSSYFGSELVTSLQILQGGHVTPQKMVGSWAGAMGHPQFMPSSFMKYAVDFRGDGHKDIWGSVPDALASTANYLKGYGWRPGETWGYEVKLPRGFDYNHVWSGQQASLGEWAGAGVARANGKSFPRAGDTARLITPMGGHGPVFAVLANFGVIKRYNNSDSYALAVGHLADRIIGGTGFVTPWPNDTALTRGDRMSLQQALLRRGYAIGTPDGVIGTKTRAAIIDFQGRAGLLPDGFPSGNLLKALA